MNNLDNIKTDAEQYIDPLGAPGSILAENHQQIVKDILTNVGKYVGAPFKAHKQLSIFPAGSMSWESKSLNTTIPFQIKTSKLTSDLNDFGLVLGTLQIGDLLRFKDFKGRSVFLLFNSFSAGVDLGGNDFYFIEVQGYVENINYTYQDIEVLDCVFEVFQQKASSIEKTSDIPLNDGSDGTSTYVESDELVPIAFSGLSVRDFNNVEQYLATEYIQFSGGTFDPANFKFSVDRLQALTIFIKAGASLSVAEPFNSTKPYPTINDAILAYKSLTFTSAEVPFIKYKVLDFSTQTISGIGMFRPLPNGTVRPIIEIESFGDIVFSNSTAGLLYNPYSITGVWNDVPTRIWDALISIKTQRDVRFTGTAGIRLGAEVCQHDIKCRNITFGRTDHLIHSRLGVNASFKRKNLSIECDNINFAGGTNISLNLDGFLLKSRTLTMNNNSTSNRISLSSLGTIDFEEIIASQPFVIGKAGKLIHGNINGTYTGNAFPYINTNSLEIEYKKFATINLPVYFTGAFNSTLNIKLIGDKVEYKNTPFLFRDFVAGVGGNTADGSNIGIDIDIRNLLIPDGGLCKDVATSGSGGARYGVGIKLTYCQIDMLGILTSGVTADSGSYSNFPPILLEVVGKCVINSKVADGTIILSNFASGTTGNGKAIINGTLDIRSGIIDTNSIDIINPTGTSTPY